MLSKELLTDTLKSSVASTSTAGLPATFSKVISGVPYYLTGLSWGCSPIAAAQVLAYYNHSGMPNGNTLIAELETTMKTINDPNSKYYHFTERNDQAPGIIQEAANHGWKVNATTYPYQYGSHTVVGVGYQYDGTHYYMHIHDGWSDSIISIDYNSVDLGLPQWLFVEP